MLRETRAARETRRLIRLGDRQSARQEYSAARRSYARARTIARQSSSRRVFGAVLARLGWTECLLGQYPSAERTLKRAIAALEGAHGPDSVPVASALNMLGVVYKYQARFSDAGPLYQRSLDILERRLGHDHTEIATLYHNLGGLEHAAGNWLRGESFAREALRIRRRTRGRGHVEVASDMAALAALLDPQKKYTESERLYRESIAIYERDRQANSAGLVVCLNNLAAVHQARGRLRQAEVAYRRALDLELGLFGPSHPKIGYILANLSALLLKRRRLREAEALSRQAIRVLSEALGSAHPSIGAPLETLADILRMTGRARESRQCTRRAAKIQASVPAVNDAGIAATATVNPLFARFRLSVAASNVHRFGVFAAETIPARRQIIEYTGEHIGRRESVRRWDPKRSYLFSLNSYWRVDGAIGGSGAEMINHSCEPNTFARILRGHIYYFSKRRIARGEELTVDYKYEADIERIPCRCGSPGCRGTINRPRQAEDKR